MSAIKGIWRDLIDKRLWPIAAALLVLIVAVPVVLARTAGDPDVDTNAQGALPVGTDSLREAVIVQADPGETPTLGTLRNPFVDAPGVSGPAGAPADATKPADDTTTAGSGSAAGAEGSGAGAGMDTGVPPGAAPPQQSGGGSTPSPNTGGDADSGTSKAGTTPKKSGSGESGYDVSLRFGTDSQMKSYKAVPRLTPLPSADSPSFVYLGVLSGGKTAVFMIAADATGAGDGTCRPNASQCETLEMKKGETMFLDVTGEDGQVTQYQLDITDIKKIGKGATTLTPEEAGRPASETRAASDVDAGRKAVRRARRTGAADTLDRYRFVRSKGVVVRRSSREVRRARARAGASSSGDLRVRRTGRVVAGGL